VFGEIQVGISVFFSTAPAAAGSCWAIEKCAATQQMILIALQQQQSTWRHYVSSVVTPTSKLP